MSIILIIGIVAGILGLFLVFAILKKIIKWMIILTTLLIMTLVGGYFFLTGDGSMTEEILPEEVQTEINGVRDGTNQKIQNKANAAKEAATQKVNEVTDKAVKTVGDGVKQAIEDGKKEASDQIKSALSGDKQDSSAQSTDDTTEENTPTETPPSE